MAYWWLETDIYVATETVEASLSELWGRLPEDMESVGNLIGFVCQVKGEDHEKRFLGWFDLKELDVKRAVYLRGSKLRASDDFYFVILVIMIMHLAAHVSYSRGWRIHCFVLVLTSYIFLGSRKIPHQLARFRGQGLESSRAHKRIMVFSSNLARDRLWIVSDYLIKIDGC